MALRAGSRGPSLARIDGMRLYCRETCGGASIRPCATAGEGRVLRDPVASLGNEQPTQNWYGQGGYGVQQARKFYNARKCDRGIPSAHTLYGLLPRVNSLANKWWERPVPAAAVIPAPQVAITIIGSKAFVAGLINLL